MPRSFITQYIISADRLQIKSADGSVEVKDLYAAVLSLDAPSAEAQANALQRVLDRIEGQVLRPGRIDITLAGVVRADLCDFKESFSLTKALPAPRAKVVVRFDFTDGDVSAFDRLVALEEDLDVKLQSDGTGFVDGHDHGQGEFCIYCHGPRKELLRQAVAAWLVGSPGGKVA